MYVPCFVYPLSFFCFFSWPRCMACGILVPPPGIKPGPSTVKVCCPNHWTAREFSIHYLLMDTCAISTFWLLWIMLLWTLVYKLSESLLSTLFGVYLGVELLDHMIILCLTLRNRQTFSQWRHQVLRFKR